MPIKKVVTDINLGTDFDIGVKVANKINVKTVSATNEGLMTPAMLADLTAATASSGTTNLSYTASPTDGTVVSDTGTDATIPVVDAINAGLMTPAMLTTLNTPSDACSLATITQPQADTLGLEDLRVVVCGTGDPLIDGNTVTLDKVAGLFGAIPSIPLFVSFSNAITITSTTATLEGIYQSDGGSPITATGFNLSLSIGGPIVFTFPGTITAPFTPFTANATGLTPNTTYYVTPFATNAIGTGYDPIPDPFTTLAQSIIYISDGGANTVVKYDTVSSTILGSTPVLSNPIGISSNATDIYVNNVLAATISKVDKTTFTQIATLNTTSQPYTSSIIIGNYLYYGGINQPTDSVYKIDLTTFLEVGSVNTGGVDVINLCTDGTYLFSAQNFATTNNVTKIDLATFTAVGNIDFGAQGSSFCEASGGFLYVGRGTQNDIKKIDIATFTVVNTLVIGNIVNTGSLIIGTDLYITDSLGITKIDLNTFTVTSSVAMTINSLSNLYLHTDGFIYIASGTTISKVDPVTMTLISQTSGFTDIYQITN